MWAHSVLAPGPSHACSFIVAILAHLAYRSDPTWWIHCAWSGNAMDGYERRRRRRWRLKNGKRIHDNRPFSPYARLLSPPCRPSARYNLWQKERTLLVKQIQLRADINGPICMPRGEYFAIILGSLRRAWSRTVEPRGRSLSSQSVCVLFKR